MSVPYLESLLYQVKVTEWSVVALPAITIFITAVVAPMPPAIRAIHN